MPDDKKKQAMSLLFGDAPPRPEAKPAASQGNKETATDTVAKTTKRQSARSPKRAVAPDARSPSKTAPAPPASVDASLDVATSDPYYQGASRYRRTSGEQVKHSVYLDPDVSQAIKVAAAMGDDPRGTNVSAIVNEALRELGYGNADG